MSEVVSVKSIENLTDKVAYFLAEKTSNTKSKKVTVGTNDGVYKFIFSDEGFDESNNYQIVTEVIPSRNIKVEILEKEIDFFTMQVMSKGVSFVDQAINCSKETREVLVTINYLD